MYIRALSSSSDGYSIRVAWQVHESYTEKWEGPQSGLSPCQGRRYSLHIYLSRSLKDGLRYVFSLLALTEIYCGVNTCIEPCIPDLCIIVHTHSAVMSLKTNISLYFLFILLMYVCSNLLFSDRTISTNSC